MFNTRPFSVLSVNHYTIIPLKSENGKLMKIAIQRSLYLFFSQVSGIGKKFLSFWPKISSYVTHT